MDSPQSVVSPFKSSSVFADSENSAHREDVEICNMEDFIGVLDVYVHQARDIHNICIYHKQDVYAKLCLTSDPESAVSTQTINGGGKSPVFNENLKLNVRTIKCSVKCEIWMMSRVRNYLEDQLLGFLFHSPAGFVHLSLSYNGTSPEVIEIPAFPILETDASRTDGEARESLPNEFDKIEFPDPKIVNENNLMVSEYFNMENVPSEQPLTLQQFFPKPVVIEPEQKVVQQDIVDMYMKSMQQFTESLAKMKLPLDIENGTTSSDNSSSDQTSQTPKSTSSRVFYGSRAFF
uniref:C2 domain-containing protein n=1 Tax=Solanum lycopersicum TaxID=4081 RepID=A0A3Q7ICF9_SOLLC